MYYSSKSESEIRKYNLLHAKMTKRQREQVSVSLRSVDSHPCCKYEYGLSDWD